MPKSSSKIKFVGAKSGRNPLRAFTDGSRTIALPEDQSKAFAHPDARAILQHAPELYKPVKRQAKRRKVFRSAESGKFVSKEQADQSKASTVSDSI